MKQSKVQSVVGEPTFYQKNQVYYHNIVMDNGDKINIGKKKLLAIGDELKYEITGDEQHEYRQAKSVFEDNSGSFNNQPKVDWDAKNKIIEFQTCLKVMGGIAINWNATAQTPESIAGEALKLYREMQNLKSEL